MLQHDNAPSHSSFLVRDFLAKHATTVLPQPPYSPDLAPADFFLFPKLKSTLKDRHFESVEAIKTNSLAHLRSIPKKAFQECFRTLKKRWQRCIQSRREYFEGDKAEQLQGKTGKFLRDIFGNFPDRPRIMNSAGRHPKSSRFFKTTALSANTVTDCVNDSAGEWMCRSVKLCACSKQQSVEMLNVSSRHTN